MLIGEDKKQNRISGPTGNQILISFIYSSIVKIPFTVGELRCYLFSVNVISEFIIPKCRE